MPIFATLFSSAMAALVGFFARFMGLQLAQKVAAYTLYISTTVAFLAGVMACLNNLLGMITVFITGGPAWLSWIMMGLGMFIPVNAAAVISCEAAIWIATGIYKIQKQGLHNYGS